MKKFFLHPLRTGEKSFRDSKQILELFDSNDITDQTLKLNWNPWFSLYFSVSIILDESCALYIYKIKQDVY